MAKELPYFKFEPNQWENGNIQMLSREDKGLFIDLCSMYWSRLGDLPYKLAIQKLCGGNAVAFNSLCDEDIFEIIDGNIYIKFLSEQLLEFENTSKQNSKNAKDRWEKHRKQKEGCDRNATALNSQCENDAIREDKRKEDNKPTTTLTHNIDKSIEICLRDLEWIDASSKTCNLDKDKYQYALNDFKQHCISSGSNDDRTIKDFKYHFVNWVKKKKEAKEKSIVKDKL